jgi:beta-glucosidase
MADNRIVPYATMFHWDLPQVLQDQYGGLMSAEFISEPGICRNHPTGIDPFVKMAHKAAGAAAAAVAAAAAAAAATAAAAVAAAAATPANVLIHALVLASPTPSPKHLVIAPIRMHT